MSRARSSSLGVRMRWNSLAEHQRRRFSVLPPTPHHADDCSVDGDVRKGLIPRQWTPCINARPEHSTALLPRYSVAACRSVGGLSRRGGPAGKHEKSNLLRSATIVWSRFS